jgi:hypothetical protein
MGAAGEIQLRNSERQAFSTCPQKWWWAYVENLKSKTPGPALRFGLLMHEAMEEFYRPGLKRGPKPADTFQQRYAAELKTQTKIGFRDDDGQWHEAGHMGTLMLEAYYAKYGKDDRWYVVATEMPFRVRIVDPVSGLVFFFVGVVDGLWRDRESGKRKDLWVVDHKSTRDDPTKKTKALILDEQAGSYWSYGVDYIRLRKPELLKGKDLTGMMFNFLRKGLPDDRPTDSNGLRLNKPSKDVLWEAAVNRGITDGLKKTKITVPELMRHIGPSAAQLGEVSKTQPPAMFHREPVFRGEHDKEMVRRRIIADARQMHYMRQGKLEVVKQPGTLHNPYCTFCDFNDMCELHEAGEDWEMVKRLTLTTWDPYAQHEIMEGR